MDVLLVQAPMPEWRRFPLDVEGVIPPLTLLYLAKPLIEKGFDVDILDFSVRNLKAEGFKSYISVHRPAVVGITCITLTVVNALKLARHVKDIDPGIKVVIGGPHVTFTARETLADPCIDVVVRGDGDINFPQLVEHYLLGKYSLDQIDGISYWWEGKIKETPRKIVKDIDIFSFPSRETIDWRRYTVPGAIQSSRGCPFKCHFCGVGAMSDGVYRRRSTGSILEEIDYLVKNLGIDHLAFLDDTMTGCPEMTKTLCRHILKKGYAVKWFCESRVDAVNEELIKLMVQAGCYWIQFGFESGSEEILKSMNKKITPQQIEKANEICIDAGIFPTGSFLIGFPEDTTETIKKTIELAKKLKQKGSYVSIGVLTPMPGTYYYNNAKELGITIHAAGWDDFEMGYPIISAKNFSRDELREILFDSSIELDRLNLGKGPLGRGPADEQNLYRMNGNSSFKEKA